MFGITPCAHPTGSLLQHCEAIGAFADCYCVEIDRQITLVEFVSAFFTTNLFKIERAILGLVLSRGASDEDAERLGRGVSESFAVWKVEDRTSNQILLKELTGRTKSWLMVSPTHDASNPNSRLYFGSALMPKRQAEANTRRMGAAFHSLLWFHKLYSQALLASAARKITLANL